MVDFIGKLSLPFIALKVFLIEAFWEGQIRNKYYNNVLFRRGDERLLRIYRHLNPYQISKAFLQNKGAASVDVYGETPLKVYDQMGRRWGFLEHHRFIELGCGRARGLFFLSCFYKCRCIGIEWIGSFVDRARQCYPNLEIYHEDFMVSENISGDFIYLYGICLEDSEIIQLCQRFKKISLTSKIITTSFSLNEYDKTFKVLDEMQVRYVWGKTTLVLNQLAGS